MKKIITLVAIATVGIVHAASVSWGASDISADSSSTVPTGFKAYLFYTTAGAGSSAVEGYINAGTVAANAAAESSVVKKLSKYNVTTVTSDVAGLDTSATYDFYVVIVNSTTGSGYSEYVMTSMIDVTYSSLAGYFGVGTASMSSATWTDAPEPTSACLLLLGIAGLALKRKIA